MSRSKARTEAHAGTDAAPGKRLRRRLFRRLTAPMARPLPQRRLFLLPTRFGLGWMVLVVVLLLFGINYQNSLAYGLAFWLFALGAVALLRGWRNLLGVKMTLRLPREVFAGGEARLGVILEASRPRTALEVHGAAAMASVDLPDGRGETVLALPAPRRGRQRLPMLRLQSRWPLGLVRVVAWLETAETLWVYPQPLELEAAHYRQAGQGREESDFAGLRRAVPGDSPTRLAWKQWSRTGVLAAKTFQAPPRQQLWLDYATCRGDLERRLSVLCARVLAHHRAGDRFGLRLPGLTLPQGEGASQRRAALDALARFPPSDAIRQGLPT
ncbi:DUF58 domain-containing protein [Halomonas korlensis]|uniref:Uncharacterized conserved protein, DUF58 family, contains vWF domain n=1 Tax=Halomonas korlensis TaxID=463301 RepID=A0A1I7I8V1_9GAMM|nr:DUF58 domain-containing protein [Halomonas korlensis]SFU69351.1 Uncharacterized conserved protein, DUF58 family, contains vWF domain [Halomonas korlensis]